MSRTLIAQPDKVYDAQEGDKFNAETTLEVVTCATCSITYAIPAGLKASALKYRGDREGGWKLCCPLGHTWWYVGETEKERLKRIARESSNRAALLSAQLDQTKAELRGQKARGTRYRNERDASRRRHAAGVCPCCGRSFKQLRQHMASQHPDYDPSPATGGET